jgi:hypothetical protein
LNVKLFVPASDLRAQDLFLNCFLPEYDFPKQTKGNQHGNS